MEGRWFLFSLSLTLLVTAANLTALQGRSRSDFIQTVGRYQEWEQEECVVDEENLAGYYSVLTGELGIIDPQTGQSCSLSVDRTQQDNNLRQDYDIDVCQILLNFTQQLLVGLNVTSYCCLTNSSYCGYNSTTEEETNKAKAYGFGTAMVVILSLLSLLGVFIVPLAKHSRFSRIYEYVNLFLVALGTSALFSDAILHLIPGVFEQVMVEFEGASEKDIALAVLWRTCAIVGGVYLFYLFEMVLHKLTSHSTTQPENEELEVTSNERDINVADADPTRRLIANSYGHRVSFGQDSVEESEVQYNTFQRKCRSLKQSLRFKCQCKCDVKPLAVLVIVGDAFHNFTDGLALGAAISQSLTLGVSTIIALAFHEIPHELGDYAILLSTGMSWYVALFFNFLSSLTALAGFFIGVSVGLVSQQANGWMLAVAAGTFLYIALVDLLPQIRNSKLTGLLALLLVNLGFLLSFAVLLLVAVYEEKFDTFIHASKI